MDSMQAFMKGQIHKDDPHKVFDWNRAAAIIRDSKPNYAEAGLSSDLEYTADTIYDDGRPNVDASPYLASCWATPVLILDDGEEIECYVYEFECDWDSSTVWPESALAILKGK